MSGASVLALFALLGGAAVAQDKKLEGKVGYVDLQKIVFDSKVGKAGIAEMKTFQEQRQKEISVKEAELLQMRKEFETKQIGLTEDAKKTTADKISDLEISLKRLLEDSDRELRDRRNRLLERIQKDIIDIIQKVSAEKGFAMVLEKDVSILYADPAYDITKAVIDRYDAGAKP